jgi:hypothetical protein
MANDKGFPAHEEVYITHKDVAKVSQHFHKMKTVTHIDSERRNQIYVTELHFLLIYKIEVVKMFYRKDVECNYSISFYILSTHLNSF